MSCSIAILQFIFGTFLFWKRLKQAVVSLKVCCCQFSIIILIILLVGFRSDPAYESCVYNWPGHLRDTKPGCVAYSDSLIVTKSVKKALEIDYSKGTVLEGFWFCWTLICSKLANHLEWKSLIHTYVTFLTAFELLCHILRAVIRSFSDLVNLSKGFAKFIWWVITEHLLLGMSFIVFTEHACS